MLYLLLNMKAKNILFSFFYYCLAFYFLLACFSCDNTTPSQTQLCMGTVCSINLYKDGTQALYDKMFQELQEIEAMFSTNLAGSDISKINQAAGKKPVTVHPEVLEVLKKACQIAKDTSGAFDPTIGPLVTLWNIGSENPSVPPQEKIKETLPLIDYTKIQLDLENNTVFLPQKHMAIDLGAIVKGYAADQLAKIATQEGVKKALFDLGGNIYAFGSKEKNLPWRVGIKNPLNPNSDPILIIPVANKSVVTSGGYERFFIQDDKRYHHILNSKSGFPVENDILSATILLENSMMADALSTAVFVLGVDKGFSLLKELSVDGIIITKNKEILATKNLIPKLQLRTNDFTLIQ